MNYSLIIIDMNGLLKARTVRPILQQASRPFSSEFKKYFGFDQKLEERKFRNDDDTRFGISKMTKTSMFFTSFSNQSLLTRLSDKHSVYGAPKQKEKEMGFSVAKTLFPANETVFHE